MTYYIQLESSDFPLSNGIVVKVKLLHILYLFKNILSTPVQLVLFKIVEYSRQCKHRYLIAHIVLLRTDNQESCSATLGPHLYSHITRAKSASFLVDGHISQEIHLGRMTGVSAYYFGRKYDM